MRVLHVIVSLDAHGAQMMLLKLLSGMQVKGVQSSVVVFKDKDIIGKRIEGLGVSVYSLGLSKSPTDMLRLFSLPKIIKSFQPDIVQTWMYHADLIGGVATKLSTHAKICWNIRHSDFGNGMKRLTWLFVRSCAFLSRRLPDIIITNSFRAKEIHEENGYRKSRIRVIPNGFDTDFFKPDPRERSRLRNELGVSELDIIIGMVGRFHSQKGHRIFVDTAAILKKYYKNVQFVLCGDGVTEENNQLMSWIKAYSLEKAFHLFGARDDIPSLLNTFDIAVSSSTYGEGFSNVIGEAMACAIPCVVTDVGDSALIVGDTGKVVPPNNSVALGNALRILIEAGVDARKQLGKAARKRILKKYSLESIVQQYESLYKDILIRKQTEDVEMSEHAIKMPDNDRFEFGKNWSQFVELIDEERIREAERSLKEMLGMSDLIGKSFLDIGSGSGLFSLAARRLGACVYSFDYDPQSVACTQKLKHLYFPNDSKWVVETGSVLDKEYVTQLGQFDVVYSWGVLHHTGAMWQALQKVVSLVAPKGILFIAIYNDQGEASLLWKKIKEIYNSGLIGRSLIKIFFYPYYIIRSLIVGLVKYRNPIGQFINYKKKRGMSILNDWVDWLGGYPFEVAKPEDLLVFYRKKGFELINLKTTNRLGCNELVFRRIS